jgi:hypothetical protein
MHAEVCKSFAFTGHDPSTARVTLKRGPKEGNGRLTAPSMVPKHQHRFPQEPRSTTVFVVRSPAFGVEYGCNTVRRKGWTHSRRALPGASPEALTSLATNFQR